jgi:hypothetical protein
MPYIVLSSLNNRALGVFTNGTRVLQSISAESTTAMSFQEMLLSHPYLILPSSVESSTQVNVQATSQLFNLSVTCSLNFSLVRTLEQEMKIFDFDESDVVYIGMNRPGKAEVELTSYGLGPDLNYSVSLVPEHVNLSASVRKLRKIEKVTIDKPPSKGVYFSDWCGLRKRPCPMALDTMVNSTKYYLCGVELDLFNAATTINCK